MTATTETRTEGRKAVAAQKRDRMLAAGYTPAQKSTRCALCTGKIAVGQYVRRMPASWQVSNPRRHAHYSCFERLQDWVRSKAAGEPVAPLTWKPRDASTAPPAKRPRHVEPESTQHIEADGQRAAAFVAETVALTGSGPTWRQLGDALGWPRSWPVRNDIVHGLSREGWLSFNREERSLRPGPAYHKARATHG